MKKSTRARSRTALPLLVVLLWLAVGCGSDEEPAPEGPTAAEQVCSARTDLSDAIQVVVDDVKAANLGEARAHASDAGASAESLTSALQDLGDEERAELQPQAEALSASLAAMGDADTLAGLRTAITALQTDLENLVTAVGDDLDCD